MWHTPLDMIFVLPIMKSLHWVTVYFQLCFLFFLKCSYAALKLRLHWVNFVQIFYLSRQDLFSTSRNIIRLNLPVMLISLLHKDLAWLSLSWALNCCSLALHALCQHLCVLFRPVLHCLNNRCDNGIFLVDGCYVCLKGRKSDQDLCTREIYWRQKLCSYMESRLI